MQDAIRLVDNSHQPFSLTAVKADKKQQSGGDFVKLKRCINVKNLGKNKRHKSSGRSESLLAPNTIYKDPNHWRNGTRNLKDLDSGKIVKVHIDLMTEINGEPIKM